MNITFQNIHKIGHIIYEDALYRQYHYPEMLSRYDSNFIEWKQMPTLEEFKKIEQALHTFHQQHGQQHVKFVFPADEKIPDPITSYLKEENYNIGFLELYTIQPSQFTVAKNPNINVQPVTEKNLEDFLKLQYTEDLRYGENFATQKQTMLRRQFQEESDRYQILAYNKEGVPVGSVEVSEKEQTAEIDNLFVIESNQRKGIGGQLQRHVMDQFPDKTIILVADGEDTPRNMYQKQNYKFQGFQYEVLKVENDVK